MTTFWYGGPSAPADGAATLATQKSPVPPDSDATRVAAELLEHSLGRGTPLQVLLNTGAFPPGWVDRYLELIAGAQRASANEDRLPRELVAAVYNASVYCTKRYNDWREREGGENRDTERRLQDLRWAGDEVLLAWFWRGQRT